MPETARIADTDSPYYGRQIGEIVLSEGGT